MKTLLINFDEEAYQATEDMRKACGLPDIGAVVRSALNLKATVDKHYRDGFTSIECNMPGAAEGRVLIYSPAMSNTELRHGAKTTDV
jgi:hypothetical protein